MSILMLPKSSPPATHRMMPRSPLYRWLAFSFLCLILFFYHPSVSHIPSISPPTVARPPPSSSPLQSEKKKFDDLSYVKALLKEHGIGPDITYASRVIRYIPNAVDRPSMQQVPVKLLPKSFETINIDKTPQVPTQPPIEISVKPPIRPDHVDASGFLFGVSTTFERFTQSNTCPVNEWKRWLTDGRGQSNGAGLILTLYNATDLELADAAKRLETVGINATVIASDLSLDMAGRYVALVTALHNHPSRPSRQYLSLIDDDTFFPAMSNLMATLSAKYDISKSYYIGTVTERVDWMLSNKAHMAYGGGGIFLTPPVAKQVAELPCLAKNDRGEYIVGGDQGDRLLYNCLRNRTEITLSYLPRLNQLDQFGDPAGFYESGHYPLSLHHYKSWHSLAPEKMHTVADACGEDCVLQRFQFEDNWIISNGFSVSHYPHGIDFDPFLMEGTFDYGYGRDELADVILSYKLGPLRQSLSRSGRKKSWHLLGVKSEGEGMVKQVYFKSTSDLRWLGEGEEAPVSDSILVLDWMP